MGGTFIIYRGDFRIHYFRKQNIISLHGEIVKSVFFVKSVRLTVSLVFLSKILFFPRSDTVVGRGAFGDIWASALAEFGTINTPLHTFYENK